MHRVTVLFVATLAAGLIAVVAGLVRPLSTAGAGLTGAAAVTGDGGALADFLDGRITNRFEDRMEAGLPVKNAAVAATAVVRYLLFHSGRAGVVIGRDGWLFTIEELERHETDVAALVRRLSFIEAAGRILSDSGVDLVVVVVPSKARILPQFLHERWAALAFHERYATAISRMRDSGITVVDPEAVLRDSGAPFLRTDTHWTPEGSRLVAMLVARTAQLMGSFPRSPRTKYRTEIVGSESVTGDLTSFIPVGRWSSALGLGPEQIDVEQTSPVSAPSLGLFDAPSIPVTLVGTSYSADPRWNFAGHLRESLELDVLDYASEAVGPFAPMADYLSSDAFREVTPALVIWEIPERYLTLPEVEVPELDAAIAK